MFAAVGVLGHDCGMVWAGETFEGVVQEMTEETLTLYLNGLGAVALTALVIWGVGIGACLLIDMIKDLRKPTT